MRKLQGRQYQGEFNLNLLKRIYGNLLKRIYGMNDRYSEKIIQQLDVEAACSNGPLEEDIYVQDPHATGL